eukprot:scaffold5087_cov430-Prasinococcus_capsulatus_cf.AAC.3
MDLISPEGLRQDGRRADEVRGAPARRLCAARVMAPPRTNSCRLQQGGSGTLDPLAKGRSAAGEAARSARCGPEPLSSLPVLRCAGRARSATLELGNTIVLAAVYGPHEVQKRSSLLHDRAMITCEYSLAPFASGERRKRQRGDRRCGTCSPPCHTSV